MCTTNIKTTECKKDDHQKWSRRSFMQTLGLASLSTTVMASGLPMSFVKPSLLMQALNNSESERVLIIIRLQGGNDGLNTIVPIYDYDNYANLRPTLKHGFNDVFKLDNDFAMPKFMNSLEQIWNSGAMKVIHGTGYEKQNLSHFRGTDIWSTGNNFDEIDTGIFGRYFEEKFPDYLIDLPEAPPAIQIGGIGDKLFNGTETNYAFTIANSKQLETIASKGTLYNINDVPDSRFGNQLSFLRSVQNTTRKYAEVINKAVSSQSNKVDFPKTDFGSAFSIVSRAIKANMGTKIYMIALNGFDTHVKQKDKHQELLTDLADSIAALYADLSKVDKEKDVLTMTFSEFGRRAKENGSKGTDHGAAAPMLLFGHGIESNGFVGEHPSLTDLDKNGNLKYSKDYIDVYGTVLKDWLCVDNTTINYSLGRTFTPINLGFNCGSVLSDSDLEEITNRFEHKSFFNDNNTYLQIKSIEASEYNVSLYNLLGQNIGTIFKGFLDAGTHHFNINNEIFNINEGIYIYRIKVGDKSYSKKIVVN